MNKYLDILLTPKNTPLWNSINNKESIDIIIWNKNYSELFTINTISEIRLSSLDVNAFNHELCHLHLNQVCGDIFSKLNIRIPPSLNDFISRECISHMANCIEHRLFYNLYLEIGGQPNKFISDYDIKKGHNFHNRISKLDNPNLDPYLGCLFSILGDCNPNINYDKELVSYNVISNIVFEASKILFDEIITIGITTQLDDFEVKDNGVVINKTHSNSCEDFWNKLDMR